MDVLLHQIGYGRLKYCSWSIQGGDHNGDDPEQVHGISFEVYSQSWPAAIEIPVT